MTTGTTGTTKTNLSRIPLLLILNFALVTLNGITSFEPLNLCSMCHLLLNSTTGTPDSAHIRT